MNQIERIEVSTRSRALDDKHSVAIVGKTEDRDAVVMEEDRSASLE